MPLTIGELLAQFSLDVSGVKKGSQEASKDFDALAASGQQAAQKLQTEFTQASDKIETSAKKSVESQKLILESLAGTKADQYFTALTQYYRALAAAAEASAKRVAAANADIAKSMEALRQLPLFLGFQQNGPQGELFPFTEGGGQLRAITQGKMPANAAIAAMQGALPVGLLNEQLPRDAVQLSQAVTGSPQLMQGRNLVMEAISEGALAQDAKNMAALARMRMDVDPTKAQQFLSGQETVLNSIAEINAERHYQNVDKAAKIMASLSGAVGDVEKKATTAARGFGVMNDAILQNRNMAFNLGMGMSSLSDIFGRVGQQMATTSIISLGLSPALAATVVGIVGVTAAVAGYITNLEKLNTLQAQANIAVRSFDAGPLDAQIKAATQQIEEWQNITRSSKGENTFAPGIVISYWQKQFSQFWENLGVGETPEKTRQRAQGQRLQLQPTLDAGLLAKSASTLAQAESASARYSLTIAQQARNTDTANAAINAEIASINKDTQAKLEALRATYEPQRDQLRETYRTSTDPRATVALENAEKAYAVQRAAIEAQGELAKTQVDWSAWRQGVEIASQMAQTNARVAESFVQATTAAARFAQEVAHEAGEFEKADTAHRAVLASMERDRQLKVQTATAAAAPEIEFARRFNPADVARLQDNLKTQIDGINQSAKTGMAQDRRAFERAQIATHAFDSDQGVQLAQRRDRLRETMEQLDVAAAARGLRADLGAQEKSFRNRLTSIQEIREAENKAYREKLSELESAEFRDDRAIKNLRDKHQDALVASGEREAGAYSQRSTQLKEYLDRVIEINSKAQQELVKTVATARQAQFAALESGLTEIGNPVGAAKAASQGAFENVAGDRAAAILHINEAVRAGQLDEERAASMRVAVNEEASAKIVEIRTKEFKAIRTHLDGLATVEIGAIKGVPGAPQIGTGLRAVDAIRSQIVQASQGLQAGQDLGILSRDEAADAGRRYAAAFSRAIDQTRAQFAGKFGSPGEPVVVHLLDELKRGLSGGLDVAATSATAFGTKLGDLRSDVDSLSTTVANGTAVWQTIIDQFASGLPTAATAAQTALSALQSQVADVRDELSSLYFVLQAVTSLPGSAGAPSGSTGPAGYGESGPVASEASGPAGYGESGPVPFLTSVAPSVDIRGNFTASRADVNIANRTDTASSRTNLRNTGITVVP